MTTPAPGTTLVHVPTQPVVQMTTQQPVVVTTQGQLYDILKPWSR